MLTVKACFLYAGGKRKGRMKKSSLQDLVIKADNAKKVNPLDLSSDQDLTVALMNLLAIEDDFEYVREVRQNLMSRIIERKNQDLWNASEQLLTTAMYLIDDGNKATGDDAYALYNRAYEFYSLFWGINMGLVGIKDINLDCM